MDKFTNRSRGFGFVEMSDNAAAQKAIKKSLMALLLTAVQSVWMKQDQKKIVVVTGMAVEESLFTQ